MQVAQEMVHRQVRQYFDGHGIFTYGEAFVDGVVTGVLETAVRNAKSVEVRLLWTVRWHDMLCNDGWECNVGAGELVSLMTNVASNRVDKTFVAVLAKPEFSKLLLTDRKQKKHGLDAHDSDPSFCFADNECKRPAQRLRMADEIKSSLSLSLIHI